MDLDFDEDINYKVEQLLLKHKQTKKAAAIPRESPLLSKYGPESILALRARDHEKKMQERRKIMSQKAKSSFMEESESESESLEEKSANGTFDIVNHKAHLVVSSNSPLRGKIRPTSAPACRSKSQTSLKHETLPLSPALPHKFSTQNSDKHDEEVLDANQWWDEPKLPRAKSESAMKIKKMGKSLKRDYTTPTLNFLFDDNPKPDVKHVPPAVYLKEYKDKKEAELQNLASRIKEEAYTMEAKCYACVEEANMYAKALGRKTHFSVFAKSNKDVDKANRFRRQTTMEVRTGSFLKEYSNDDVKGAGCRIEKMLVEMVEAPGEPSKLLHIDTFFLHHNKLQIEFRRLRSLMPSSERVEQDKIKKVLAKEKLKMDRGKRKTAFNSTTLLAIGEKTSAKPVNPQQLNNKTQGPSRAEIEQMMKNIIDESSLVTKQLEDQLLNLQDRGWNENVA